MRSTASMMAVFLLSAGSASGGSGVDERVNTQLPELTITAEKRPALARDTPLSVTAIGREELASQAENDLKGVTRFVPNLNVIEFTARAISNPKARGVGGSPNNPAVTTVLDGVPLLNGDLTNLELFNVQQIEVVRGPIGALYGRNTPGGVINVLTRMPTQHRESFTRITLADDAQRRWIGGFGTTVADQSLGFSVAGGQHQRDGYSFNGLSQKDLDFRNARFARAQLAWIPNWRWASRLIVASERARDGDFGLYDLAALRDRPRYVEHDFTGFTHRDVDFYAGHLSYFGDQTSLRLIAAHVPYRAHEQTDLDLSAADRLTRDNKRIGRQTTMELLWSSAEQAPIQLPASATLQWQLGLFNFRQQGLQDAINKIRPAFILEFAGLFLPQGLGLDSLPSDLRSQLGGARYQNLVHLHDRGIGVFGQAQLRWGAWELGLGLRWDEEHKRGDLSREFFYVDANDQRINEFDLASTRAERRFTDLSPRVSLSWSTVTELRLYTSWAKGYRAGGFNVTPADGHESYNEDYSTQLELGMKSLWFDQRLVLNLAWFQIDLDDLQFNLPAPRSFYGNLGDFYIANVGNGRNRGWDLELQAQLLDSLKLRAAASLLNARFGPGSRSQDQDISGKRVPLSAERGLILGLGWSLPMADWRWSVQPTYQYFGGYYYDETNNARQPSYEQFHLNLGLSKGAFRLNLWGRNLSDAESVPLAIPFDGIAPSDYAGESAAPRIVGIDLQWQW